MIHKASGEDATVITEMAMLLWEGHEFDELYKEYEYLINSDESAVFIVSEDNKDIGFAQVQLRHDYVEGTESSPVGYLEGIFVKEDYRKCGYALALLKESEQWAKQKGCTEFASDCPLTNNDSFEFHLNAGFEEANRIICFTKKL